MKQQLQHLIHSAIKKLQIDGKLPHDIEPNIQIERTRDKQHGDFATNIALSLAKTAKTNPRDLAQLIIDAIAAPEHVETIEIAGPGFINFYLNTTAFRVVITDIINQAKTYGHTDIGKNKTVNVEFVSANPTGPLHVGHGRGAAYGDTIANLLETMGFQVDREYYVNDAGRQMHVLAVSVWLRYLSLFEDLPHFPKSGYKGDYIIDIAKQLQKEHSSEFKHPINEVFTNLSKDEADSKEIYIDELVTRAKTLLGERNYSLIFDLGIQTILNDIKQDLAEFGITFQKWFLESSLVTNGGIKTSIEQLQQRDHIYEKDGALWFRATTFGDDKDRVVVRENGLTTYFASDIGYHLNKYNRGYDKIIDVFGADHHGYAPRIKAFLRAEGLDVSKFEVPLVQFAILYRNKEKVQMSTRSGEFVTLRELREEVGNDAARFFYIMRKNDQHLDFDLDLAKSQSSDNPVYYIQYAHARICSVMRQLADKNLTWEQTTALDLLREPQEEDILRRLQQYNDILHKAAMRYEPHTLAHYLQELANDFHTYYNAQQFIVADDKLRNARLSLILAVKQIIANGLTVLGVAAPEMM